MSEQLIYALIPKVMADIGAIGKGQENQFDKYKFRGIDDVYNAVQPAFVKHGIFCAPSTTEKSASKWTTDKGKPMVHVVLTVAHKFYATDGSFVEVITVGEAMDRGDKAANKAMAAAYKYALFGLFCIPTEGDNDTENHSPGHEGDGHDGTPEVRMDHNGEQHPVF